MNIKKIIMAGMIAAASLALGEVAVTGVTAKQRYPWNGLVDITVTLSGTEEECKDETLTIPLYATNKTTRAELPVRTVRANGAITGEGNQWTQKLIWDATADVGCAKFGEVELITGTIVTAGGVQLWEDGPYWAECNIGATKPDECGYYFWWGDVVGYKRNANDDGWISVKDSRSFSFIGNNCPTEWKSYSALQSSGYIDSAGNLVAAHDAATAHLGSPWRMPTDAEVSALVDNCDTEWTTYNGAYGWLVKGRGLYSSKSIFLPAVGAGNGSNSFGLGSVGVYWSSTPSSDDSWCLLFRSDYFICPSAELRWQGRSVRPVRRFVQ